MSRGTEGTILLPPLHGAPVEKTVGIVAEKGEKAGNHGDAARVLHGRQRPQNHEHHVVCGVGQGVKGTAEEGKPGGQEAGGDGKSAEAQTCRTQGLEDEIKDRRNEQGKKHHSPTLPGSDAVDGHLLRFGKGMAQKKSKKKR